VAPGQQPLVRSFLDGLDRVAPAALVDWPATQREVKQLQGSMKKIREQIKQEPLSAEQLPAGAASDRFTQHMTPWYKKQKLLVDEAVMGSEKVSAKVSELASYFGEDSDMNAGQPRNTPHTKRHTTQHPHTCTQPHHRTITTITTPLHSR